MIKKCFALLASIVITCQVLSQDKLLTLKDAVYLNPKIYPGSLSKLDWKGKTGTFCFVENNKMVQGSVKSSKNDTILDVDKINEELKKIKEKPLKRFPSYKWLDDNTFMFKKDSAYFSYDLENTKTIKLNNFPSNAENVDICEETFNIAYTKGNNLYLSVNGKEIVVSSEKNEAIVYGQEVHRREFGIHTGTFWSPEGTYLAFYRKDETMVTDYPKVEVNHRIAKHEPFKYPMAGMKSHHVTLGVYNVKTGEIVYMKTGEPKEHYLTNIAWGPNEEFIYIAELNRGQDHLQLNKYNAKTGMLEKNLFEEKDAKYVEPLHEPYFLNENSNQFLWFSRRNGVNQLYLYNTQGELINKVTKDENIIVKSILGTGDKEKTVYFKGIPLNSIQKHIYVASLKNGKVTKLTSRIGSHSAKFSDNGKYFISVFNSHTEKVTSEYSIMDAKGKKLKTLLGNSDPLKDYNLGKTEIIELKADDGTKLFGRLIKPADFDPNEKYPAIVYVYGGPHAQLVTDSWLAGGGLFLNYLAQRGYVIFTLDNRGSDNRGKAFEQIIYRNVGVAEMADQLKGVEYLKSLDFVDESKIGVDGWSYGGFMTMTLMLKNPGVFKVGCAGGPVIDWKLYEVMYGERYMDTPQDNPEGYENANLLNYVDSLQDKLMIIHCTHDPVVMWQNSLQFIEKAISKGKQLDYFVYPGHKHNVSGLDRMHLYEKIHQYFDDFLK